MGRDPVFLIAPPLVQARPAGLASLGRDSYFVEPYMIRSPHRVHVGDGVSIGANSFLSVLEEFEGVDYDPELRIGDGCAIGGGVHVACAGRMVIGRRVAIGPRVFIGDIVRDYQDLGEDILDQGWSDPKPVAIGDGAAVGIGAIVLPGVTVGERGIVAAGAVVTRDVAPRTMVFGNPARVVRSWDPDRGAWVAGVLSREPSS